jgi:hypothetical protein
MVTDVLRVPGNYKIDAPHGSAIEGNPGILLNSPLTVVSGNLIVQGVTTQIESQNATIKDNIIILNSGETNNYVSLGTAGFLVARGNSDSPLAAAALTYDDTPTNVFAGQSLRGVWSFGSSLNTYGYVAQMAAITIPSSFNTLTFFSSVNPNAVLSVKGTVNYKDHVLDPDHIPNKAYVDTLLANTEFANKLLVGSSFVEINDDSISTSSVYFSNTNTIKAALGGTVVFQLVGNAAQFSGLTISNNRLQIRNTLTNVNLSLEPGPNGIVNITSGFRIQKTPAISSQAGYTAIYSTSTVGGGGTGLYYVNTAQTDELVSRRRSIIYGIIF